MLEIIREYSFDVNFETGKFKRTDGSEERIKLVQNDNESTKFKFNFEEEIADNTNVLVRLRQFTGYVKEYTMLIQNQKAEIILTNDILSESGSLTMSITLIGTDDEILTDTEYHSKMYVLASLEGNTEIPEQEKSVLVDLISQVNSLNQTASQLVEESETAVTNSSTVLANAETALQNANTATQNANDATTNANTATQNANVAAQNANNAVTELDNRLANKVDKVNGKDLSTNDYDNAEKEKNETNRTEILRRALITETGNKIELEINNQTYILTAKLYDKNNNLISTSNSIDLPLETMIVNATYNNNTKKIVLTLQSGSTVEFSIADLIDGLVNETTFNETIEELQAENKELKEQNQALEKEVEDLKDNELVATESGESIDVYDSANAENRGIKVIGKSWQNTTTGKNKLKLEDDTMFNYGITVTILDGKISIKGTSTDNYLWIKLTNGITMRTGTPSISNSPNWFNNNLLSGKVYTFSQIGNCDEDFFFTKNDGTRGDLIRTNETSKTVDLTETVMSDVAMYIGASGTNVDIEFYIQAVEGNDADYNYEPYTNGASPNPEYEQPIHNCSGSINFKAENKNLAWNGWAEDFAERINNSYAASIITYNNRNCLNWKAYAGYQQYDKKYMFKTNFKENTQYTFVFNLFANNSSGQGNICIEYTDNTKDSIHGSPNNWAAKKIVSSINKTIKFLRAEWFTGDCYIDLDTFMVLEGAYTAENITDYIAHEEQNITFPLKEGQVLAQDDYLADDGIHHVRKQVVLDGTEECRFFNYDEYKRAIYSYSDIKLTSYNSVIGALSNKFKGVKNQDMNYLEKNTIFLFENKKEITILLKDGMPNIIDMNSWIEYVSQQYENGTPLIIEYLLETPIIEPYTSQQAQVWKQIKALRTYKNITYISSEDETKPTLEVTYVRDLPKEIDILSSLNLSVVDGLINIEYEEE